MTEDDSMPEREQVHAFAVELDALIDRYRQEFDLPCYAVIGVLQIQKHLLCAQLMQLAKTPPATEYEDNEDYD